MATPARDLRSRTRELAADAEWRAQCRRCGSAKAPSMIVVHDASAMYDRFSSDQAAAAADVVARVLRERRFRGVGVQDGPRLARRILRQSGMSQTGCAFVDLHVMVDVLKAALQVNMATFGDVVVRQRGGLPIVGPLSDPGAGLLLGLQDATWRQHRPWRDEHLFTEMPNAAAVDKWVAQTRYVGDIMSTSTAYCTRCLTAFLEASHPLIPFALEEDSAAGPVRWLDLVVHGSRLPLHVATSKPETDWLSRRPSGWPRSSATAWWMKPELAGKLGGH